MANGSKLSFDEALRKNGLLKDEGTDSGEKLSFDEALQKHGLTAGEGATKVRPGMLPAGIQQLGAGLSRGMIEGTGGLVQLAGDAIDKLAKTAGMADPELGQTVTNVINEWRAGNERAFPENMPIIGSTDVKDVGEFIGNILPYVAAPMAAGPRAVALGSKLAGRAGAAATTGAAAATAGGAIGATQFAPSETPEGRDVERFSNLLTGAAGGVAGQAVGSAAAMGITKLKNTSAVTKMMEGISEQFEKYDPNLNKIREKVDKQINKVHDTVNERKAAEDTYGDKLANHLQLDDLGEAVSRRIEQINSSVDPNGRVRNILERIQKRVAPESPEVPADLAALGEPSRSQALKLWREAQKPPEPLRYSELRGMGEDIDKYLRGRGDEALTNRQTSLLQQTREEIETELTSIRKQYPDLNSLSKNTKKADRDLAQVMDTDLRNVRDGDPFERAEALVRIATSGDKELAKKTAGVIGSTGKKEVSNMLVKKALDAATDKEGHLDPARFGKFFQENKGTLKLFMDEEAGTIVKGVENLITEHALRTGRTVADSRGMQYVPRYMLAGGLAATLVDPLGGLSHLAKAGATTAAFKLFEHMLRTDIGRNFLAASAQVRPGTPRSARLFDGIAKRFGPLVGTDASVSSGEE